MCISSRCDVGGDDELTLVALLHHRIQRGDRDRNGGVVRSARREDPLRLRALIDREGHACEEQREDWPEAAPSRRRSRFGEDCLNSDREKLPDKRDERQERSKQQA